MNKVTKRWIVVIVFLICVAISLSWLGKSLLATTKKDEKEVRNVILLIGDGMGVSYTSAYRYYKNPSMTFRMSKTGFDPYLVGTQITYPNDLKQNVTDSAAAGTAMATGKKTYNKAISVDTHKRPLETILERAKKTGKSTGMVVTKSVLDATPASFAAHTETRKNYTEIANQYFDDKINQQHKVDVLLGGGEQFFVRPDRNIVKEFQNDGYGYVTNKEELLQNKNSQILGLFSSNHMPMMIDRSSSIPSLREMTNAALTRLNKNKNGFFLMVEGSQIDRAGHRHDITGVMSEMEDFEAAFQTAIEFAKKDQHTLVVATADHTTGGLTVGRDKIYAWNPEPIKNMKRTACFIASQIKDGKDIDEVLDNYISFPITSTEKKAIYEAPRDKILDEICKVISNRTHTGWTTKGHTGEDVPVYAFGPGKEKFLGTKENTNIANSIFQFFN